MLRGVSCIAVAWGLAAATISFVGAFAPTRAHAADLGGDCCADLEERVATLEATTVTKGNRKVSLEVSGRIDVNVMWWKESSTGPSNGEFDKSSGVAFGDSATDNHEPRLTFSGSGVINRDLVAGFLMQLDFPFSGFDTQTSTQGAPNYVADTTYVFLKSKSLGELRLGYMASSSDDAYYLNFGGGSVGGLSGLNHTGTFRLRDINGALSDTPYSSVLGEMSDYNENRLMYISPTIAGFTVKADVGGDQAASTSLTWIHKFNTVEVEAGVGYQVAHGQDGDCFDPRNQTSQCLEGADTVSVNNAWSNANHSTLRSLGTSASIWDTASGLYLSGETSRVYTDLSGRQDPVNWFVQAGWAKNATGIGQTTVYASYDRTSEKMANDTAAHYWNVGVEQAIDSVASNIYLHYQHDSFDTDGEVPGSVTSTGFAINSQSIDSVTGGMVVHF